MAIRIMSALAGAAIFIAICFAGKAVFMAAVLVVAATAAFEFIRAEMTGPPVENIPRLLQWAATWYRNVNPAPTALSVGLVPFCYYLPRLPARAETVYAFTCMAAIFAFCEVVKRALTTGRALGWCRAFYGKIGFFYIGLLFGSFVLLRDIPGRIRVAGFGQADAGALFMLFTAVCVWAADSFAYFVGRAVGKHKMAPLVSPGKTMEGFAGGLAGAIIAGALLGRWIGLEWSQGILVGMIGGVFGPIGDLFASALKRELGIKDFGTIMPGHGGVLDRFDSLMFAAPAAYLVLAVMR